MKGIKGFVFVFLVMLLLTACGTDTPNADDNSSDNQATDEQTDSKSNEEPSDFPEMTYISEKIKLDQYEMMVETNNEGSRVLFFSKGGQKHYKSVYVKEEKRLKLLDIYEGGEPLIDEVIE